MGKGQRARFGSLFAFSEVSSWFPSHGDKLDFLNEIPKGGRLILFITATRRLHGLGDSPDYWRGRLRSRLPPAMRLCHPSAPQQAVAAHGGGVHASWFDICTWPVSRPNQTMVLPKQGQSAHTPAEAFECLNIPSPGTV